MRNNNLEILVYGDERRKITGFAQRFMDVECSADLDSLFTAVKNMSHMQALSYLESAFSHEVENKLLAGMQWKSLVPDFLRDTVQPPKKDLGVIRDQSDYVKSRQKLVSDLFEFTLQGYSVHKQHFSLVDQLYSSTRSVFQHLQSTADSAVYVQNKLQNDIFTNALQEGSFSGLSNPQMYALYSGVGIIENHWLSQVKSQHNYTNRVTFIDASKNARGISSYFHPNVEFASAFNAQMSEPAIVFLHNSLACMHPAQAKQFISELKLPKGSVLYATVATPPCKTSSDYYYEDEDFVRTCVEDTLFQSRDTVRKNVDFNGYGFTHNSLSPDHVQVILLSAHLRRHLPMADIGQGGPYQMNPVRMSMACSFRYSMDDILGLNPTEILGDPDSGGVAVLYKY